MLLKSCLLVTLAGRRRLWTPPPPFGGGVPKCGGGSRAGKQEGRRTAGQWVIRSPGVQQFRGQKRGLMAGLPCTCGRELLLCGELLL